VIRDHNAAEAEKRPKQKNRVKAKANMNSLLSYHRVGGGRRDFVKAKAKPKPKKKRKNSKRGSRIAILESTNISSIAKAAA
jgi:hypothetical protein